MQRLLAGVVHVPGRSALDLGGGKGKMEGADWFGFLDRMTGFTGGGFRQNLQNYKILDKNPPTRFELTGSAFWQNH